MNTGMPGGIDPELEHSGEPLRTGGKQGESITIDAGGRQQSTSGVEARQSSTRPMERPLVPGYEITAEVARGGMGCVYAGRDLTLHREVAIKTLLSGADPERFNTESRITARLAHPGIPPVHALGTLDNGALFLVMKLIRGQTLAELLRQRNSSPDDLSSWLQIFEQIAQAVGYAHSQGIVHRDLKPLNIMVGAFGEVQVMDWGLAKDLHAEARSAATTNAATTAAGRATDLIPTAEAVEGSTRLVARASDAATVSQPPKSTAANPGMTQAGTVMGTPSYMAPEQARGEPVDARADVFALGGILSVILTGQPVFAGSTAQETIRKAASADLNDALARLDACGAEPELVALARGCLTADVESRLADARAVAAAVASFRAGVAARLRQAETERAAAQVRATEERKRRRQLFMGAAVVAAVLVAGIVGTAIGLFQAREEAGLKEAALAAEKQRADGETLAKRQAQENETKAEIAKEAEARAAKLAREKEADERLAKLAAQNATEKALALVKELDRRIVNVERASALMESIFQDIDPFKEKQGGPLLLDQLTKRLLDAADHLDDDVGDPSTVARLQLFLGRTLSQLGEHAKAIDLLTKARDAVEKQDPDNPNVLIHMRDLSMAYRSAGKYDQALALQQQTLEKLKDRFGEDHPTTLGEMNSLASTYKAVGKLDLAIPLYQQALASMKLKPGPDHLDTIKITNNLGNAYESAGKPEQAVPLFEDALTRLKAKFGDDNPFTIVAMGNLANAYDATGKAKQALPLFQKALDLHKAKFGPDHPTTLKIMNNFALTHGKLKRFDLAIPLLQEALDKMRMKLPDHPDIYSVMCGLAKAHQITQKPNLAIPLFEEALEGRRSKLGPDHPATISTLHDLTSVYFQIQRFDRAIPLAEEHLTRLEKRLGRDHPETLWAMAVLGVQYHDFGRIPDAVPLLEAVNRASGKSAKLRSVRPHLLDGYASLGMAAPAAALSKELLAEERDALPKASVQLASALSVSAIKLLRAGAFADAEGLLREALAILEKSLPNAWYTSNTKSLLGACLLGQKKHDDAEPLLKDGYEGMKARFLPPSANKHFCNALGYLVQLYRVTDNKEELEKWTKILEERQKREGKLVEPIHDLVKSWKQTGQLDKNTPALLYQIRLKAGARCVIDMTSPDPTKLDPFVQVRDANGITLAEDDDGGGNLNARLFIRAPTDGVYRIHASSVGAPQGEFTLSIQSLP